MKKSETLTHELTDSKNKRRCTQTRCSFYLQGGCKNCDDCKSEPYVINTECQRCLSCENVPNAIRWGEQKGLTDMRQCVQIQQPIMIHEPNQNLPERIIIVGVPQ